MSPLQANQIPHPLHPLSCCQPPLPTCSCCFYFSPHLSLWAATFSVIYPLAYPLIFRALPLKGGDSFATSVFWACYFSATLPRTTRSQNRAERKWGCAAPRGRRVGQKSKAAVEKFSGGAVVKAWTPRQGRSKRNNGKENSALIKTSLRGLRTHPVVPPQQTRHGQESKRIVITLWEYL